MWLIYLQYRSSIKIPQDWCLNTHDSALDVYKSCTFVKMCTVHSIFSKNYVTFPPNIGSYLYRCIIRLYTILHHIGVLDNKTETHICINLQYSYKKLITKWHPCAKELRCLWHKVLSAMIAFLLFQVISYKSTRCQ